MKKEKHLLIIFLIIFCTSINSVYAKDRVSSLSQPNENGSCVISSVGEIVMEVQENKELSNVIAEELVIKNERLKELNTLAESGQDVWEEIYLLEREIYYLKVNYSRRKFELAKLEVLKNFIDSNFTTYSPTNVSEIGKSRVRAEMLSEKISISRWRLISLYQRVQYGEDTWNEIKNLQSEINVLWEEQNKAGLDYTKLYVINELESSNVTSNESINVLTITCFFCGLEVDPPSEGWSNLSGFKKGKVWVGTYSSTIPEDAYFLDKYEYCDGHFTKDISYYWSEAIKKSSEVKSIQIKWIYTATNSKDGREHDIIWEGNANGPNPENFWLTYGNLPSSMDVPPDGNYWIGNDYWHLKCCYTSFPTSCGFANTHCGNCFAPDQDGYQHFVRFNEYEYVFPDINNLVTSPAEPTPNDPIDIKADVRLISKPM